MTTTLIDLTGQDFGRWHVIERAPDEHTPGGQRRTMWLCRCSCPQGTTRPVFVGHLRSGASQSCGCLQRDVARVYHLRHGGSGTPEHNVWKAIVQRCTNDNNAAFENYKGRGIVLADRWLDFENFLADMGPRPSHLHSIERKDNDGPYAPGNCIWALRVVQNANTRQNVRLTLRGETLIAAEWSRRTGIPSRALLHRKARGWSDERALTEPLHINRGDSRQLRGQ